MHSYNTWVALCASRKARRSELIRTWLTGVEEANAGQARGSESRGEVAQEVEQEIEQVGATPLQPGDTARYGAAASVVACW